jgi:hypothetical protein
MHQATTTMTGSTAIRALNTGKKKVMKFPSANECYNLQKDFVDWCETQHEDLLRNTGSIY